MLRSLDDLRGYKLHATDGELGGLNDLLFDDVTWRVRYFVADTGGWLTGRRVLLSPESIRQAAWPSKQISVALTKEQIRNSPPVETEAPFSRQQELAMVEYYGWPSYWAGPNLGPMAIAPIVAPATDVERASAVERGVGVMIGEEPDTHLRSLQEVRGYHIAANDGMIGHLTDLVVEDEDWTIRYLVVDTRNWIPGRKVLVAPCWAQAFNWQQREIRVDLTREQVKNSPTYDPAAPVNRAYEVKLYDYYGRPSYW
jgi:3D (Asp-Asp-Asp) domain-containing protein